MENKKSKRVPARDRVRERSREDRDKQRHTHTYSSTLRVQEQQLSQSALTSHGRVLVFYPPPLLVHRMHVHMNWHGHVHVGGGSALRSVFPSLIYITVRRLRTRIQKTLIDL